MKWSRNQTFLVLGPRKVGPASSGVGSPQKITENVFTTKQGVLGPSEGWGHCLQHSPAGGCVAVSACSRSDIKRCQ